MQLNRVAYQTPDRASVAITRVEVSVIVAIFAIAVAMVTVIFNRNKPKSKAARCQVRLRELGIAFSSFGSEFAGKVPWGVSTNVGGSLELTGAMNLAYQHFLPLSNYASSPGRLLCPQDERRTQATWHNLQNTNISYF